MKAKVRQDKADGKRLLDMLDVNPGEDVGEVLIGWADLDDLTPNQIKTALLEVCRKQNEGRHDLRAVLRAVLDSLFDDIKTRRPRVGANWHWPRLLQYLRELEEETDWSPDGQGFRLANIGGRGPVARQPRDPASLSIIIEPDYI